VQQPLHCLQCVEQVDDGFRDCLTHAASKIPTVQYIIYNIKRVVWRLVSSGENDSTHQYVSWSSSSPPPSPKKKNPQPTQKRLPHEISHHQCTYPDIDPIGKSPSINPVNRTTVKDSYPEPASDHTLTPSRTHISNPFVILGNSDDLVPSRVNNLPSRGTTRPSTPSSPHWCEENYPKVSQSLFISRFISS
jgi:hypothetical protein